MNKAGMALGLALAVSAACAADAWLRGTTAKDPLAYAPGEEMIFTLTLEDGAGEGKEIAWERTGDDGKKAKGRGAATGPVVVKTSLDRPGFVRIYAEVVAPGAELVGCRSRNVPTGIVFFDGGAGVNVDAIRPGVPAPKDFDAFWAKHKANLAAVPMKDVKVVELPCANAKVKLCAVEIPCAGPRPATGYLTVPTAPGKYPARIGFHGYGASWGKAATDAPNCAKDKGDEVVLMLSAHGFELNRDAAYYKAFRKTTQSNGHTHAFDPKQNSDPETAYFCGMTYRVMRGLEYLKSRPEWNGKDLTASGGSQGGLQAIWAAALDPQVSACEIAIPWCCDIGGTEVGRNRGTWYVEWVPALGFYDPVNMAARIPKSCRVNIARAGLGDYTCPPAGIAAFYNSLTAPKRIVWVQGSTHGYVPPKAERYVR